MAASGGQKPQLAGSAPEGGAPLFESSQPPAGPQGRVNVFGEFGDRPSASPRMGTGGFEQVTFLDEGYDSDVQVSPDGKWLVFASTRHNERPEIYLQRIGGVTVTQLTSDQADDGFPTFSPDGRRIAFSSTRNGNWDIYLMDIDGRHVTQVTSSNMQELHPSFSPDGTRLVYCATGTRSGQWELWIVDLRTSERRMIGYGLFPEFSPDPGRERIVFQRPRQRGSRWFSIWTADLVEGEARNLTEVAVSGNAAVVSPTWSRCGSMIAFSTIVNPGLENSAAGGTQQDVWVINSDGTGRRRITDGNGVNATPSWSKDGRLFFVSDRGGVEAVWAAQVVGGPLMTAGQRHGEDPFASTDKDSATP
ncbi:MAG: DPP IV N-terminal domain-containing protein [Phycisphaerae bacterium]|nr:DPP IV N-terminal domain-containing protein [Phycisphaerae bacterium]